MKHQEREISIGNLLWKLIFGWRVLLISAVTVAILITVVFYLKDMTNYENAKNQQQSSIEEKDDYFTEEEREQIQNAEVLQELIEEKQSYAENSILMNIDPYEEHVLSLRYYVESDYQFNFTEDNSLDYTSAVVASYEEFAGNGGLEQRISEALELDCDRKYLKELISIKESTAIEVFSIEVVYPDKEKLLEMADVIKEDINKQTGSISENVGSHSLKLLSENVTVKTDGDLANQQKGLRDIINSYRTELKTLTSSMTEMQLERLDDEKAAGEVAETDNLSIAKPEVRIKYMILGFAMGIFLAVIWIVCKMLFTGNFQNSDELVEIYGLRLFGTLQAQGKISGLDKLFLKIRNRHKKQMTQEQIIDIISSNIELTCENENISQFYLTGSEIERTDKGLLQQIMDRLKKAGVEVFYGENICYDAASLRKLVQVGNVVLLEQEEISKYQEIEKEIKIITEQKVKILGCIGIDKVCK